MRRWNRWIGIVIGAIALVGGVVAVAFVDFSPTPPPPKQVVRLVKSAIVQEADAVEQLRFRGEVVPGKTVDLAFQVGGQILEASFSMGRPVEENAVLAKLDTKPMDQQIAVLEPTAKKTQEKLRKIKVAVGRGVATAIELSESQAAYDEAAAQLKIAQQAKKDATLRAPFTCLIVKRFFEKFENVQAGQPVVSLQDISTVDIRVELPESVVARHRDESPATAKAQFPVLPGKSLDVEFKEASTQADPTTGGYLVTFTMPRPKGATILPGMGATIVLTPPATSSSQAVKVPVQAIFVDATSGRCVWRLTEKGEALVATKVPVKVKRLTGDVAIVSEGLQPGWRVATAGVHFLREGQIVRLMEQSR